MLDLALEEFYFGFGQVEQREDAIVEFGFGRLMSTGRHVAAR